LPPSRSAPLTRQRDGSFAAAVDAQRLRVLVSGKMTAQLRFLDARKDPLLTHDFRFQSDRAFLLAANGLLALLLIAFLLSYGRSWPRRWGRGGGRRWVYVGMGILGGVMGAAVVDLAWALRGPPLTLATVVVGVVLGVVALLAFTHAILMMG